MGLLWWHRPGQRVVFVECEGVSEARMACERFGVVAPTRDGTYTIRDVVLHRNGRIGFRLVEIVNASQIYADGPAEATFCSTNFRPVRDTSIESLRALLNPPPDVVREVFEEMIDEAAYG